MTAEEMETLGEKMFTDKLKLREFCVKLELSDMNVSGLERKLGTNKGYLSGKVLRKPWFDYLSAKYPERFKTTNYDLRVMAKSGNNAHGGNFLSTVRIPCMVCGKAVMFTYETSEGIPRGVKKRCSSCNKVASSVSAGVMDDQPVFGA